MLVFESLSDQELLIHLKDDREPAFDEIYKRYWKKVYNQTYKRLKNNTQTDEIVQDVFISLWNRRAGIQIDNLLPYLIQAARFQIYSLYKKQTQLPFIEVPIEHMAHSSMDADSLFFAKELKGCIKAWMDMQPDRRREIFRLRYLEEYSTKEISEMLNISQKTVQKTLFKALESLKKSLFKFMLVVPVLMAVHRK